MALSEKRYVIIDNGIAGTTAAETLRKNDPNCSIHLCSAWRHARMSQLRDRLASIQC